MSVFEKRHSIRYRTACVCDALALPVIVLLWFRSSHPGAWVASPAEHHTYPGLFASSVMMIVAARALMKVEQALRMPEEYRWDLERALRWFALLAVMALGLWFLA